MSLKQLKEVLQSIENNDYVSDQEQNQALKEAEQKYISTSLTSITKENGKDNEDTLLTYAISVDMTKLALALVSKSFEINTPNDNGNTPLHVAVRNGSFEVVEILLKAKASLSIKNNDGYTPLYCALIEEDLSIDGKKAILQAFINIGHNLTEQEESALNLNDNEQVKVTYEEILATKVVKIQEEKKQIEEEKQRLAEAEKESLSKKAKEEEAEAARIKKLKEELGALDGKLKEALEAQKLETQKLETQKLHENQEKARNESLKKAEERKKLQEDIEADKRKIEEIKAQQKQLEEAKLKDQEETKRLQAEADRKTKEEADRIAKEEASKKSEQNPGANPSTNPQSGTHPGSQPTPPTNPPTNPQSGTQSGTQPGSPTNPTSPSKFSDLKVYTKIDIDSLFPKVSKDNKPHENQELLNASLAWHYFTTKSKIPHSEDANSKILTDNLNELQKLTGPENKELLAELRQQIVGDIEQRNTSGGEYRPAGKPEKPQAASEEHYPGLQDSSGELEYFSFDVGKGVQLDLAVTEDGQVHVAEESLRKIKLSGLTLSVKIPGDNDGEQEYLEFVNGKLMFIDHGPDSHETSRLANLKAAIHGRDREVERDFSKTAKEIDLTKAAKSIKDALIDKNVKHLYYGESFPSLRKQMEEYDKLYNEELIKYDKLKAGHEAKISLEEKSLANKDYPKQISLIDSNIGNLTKSFVETSNAINSINLKANEVNKEKNKVNKQINSTNQQIHEINHERDEISATIDSLNEIIRETELKRKTDKYGNETVIERSNRWQKSLLGLGKNSRYLLGLVSNAAKNANQREDLRLEAHKEIKELQDGLKELNRKSEKLSENLKKQTERNKLLDVEADGLNNNMIILSKKSSELSDQITSQNQKKSQLQDENSEHQNKILKLNLSKDGELETAKKKIDQFSQAYEQAKQPYLEYQRREKVLSNYFSGVESKIYSTKFLGEYKDYDEREKIILLNAQADQGKPKYQEIEISADNKKKYDDNHTIMYGNIPIPPHFIHNLSKDSKGGWKAEIHEDPAILIQATRRVDDEFQDYLAGSYHMEITDKIEDTDIKNLSTNKAIIYISDKEITLHLLAKDPEGKEEDKKVDLGGVLRDPQLNFLREKLQQEKKNEAESAATIAKREALQEEIKRKNRENPQLRINFKDKAFTLDYPNFSLKTEGVEGVIKNNLETYMKTIPNRVIIKPEVNQHINTDHQEKLKERLKGILII